MSHNSNNPSRYIISQLTLSKHETQVQLLIKILSNILNNPNNDKYMNLNFEKVAQKCAKCKVCIDLLYECGFYRSEDSKRLFYDMKKIHKAKDIHERLSLFTIGITDTTNMKNLDALASEICQYSAFIDSSHLFLPTNIHNTTTKYGPIVECKLQDCLCVNIVSNVLKRYHMYIKRNRESNDDWDHLHKSIFEIYQHIGNNYNTTDLLDDFNHLLVYHSNEFEDIYNLLNKTVYDDHQCDLLKCFLMKRNHRDRQVMGKSDNVLKRMYFSADDIIEQQLLDRIHCYFFHTFDIGYKMTKLDKQKILIADTKIDVDNNDYDANVIYIDNLITSKTNTYRNIKALKRLQSKENKFKMLNEYSYGYRFFYWTYYIHNLNVVDQANRWGNTPFAMLKTHANPGYYLSDWYIQNKYSTFKEELLCNEICTISNEQWIHLMATAMHFLGTEKVKGIFCPRKESAEYFEMRYGQMMHQYHLIALLVHCNFDVLQNKFNETFRKKTVHESDSDLKIRHSNYYFFARLLRECVECYGMDAPHTLSFDITVYHGTTRQFLFSSMNAYIRGSFSTTTNYAVAINFCHNTGMILELCIPTDYWNYKKLEGKEALNRICCFDCSWISNYPNEQEILCVGGLNSFKINSITEPNGTNYQLYMNGLRQMTAGMDNGGGLDLTFPKEILLDDYSSVASKRIELQMVYRLLSHELFRYLPKHEQANEFESCPDYFKEILHSHCINIKSIYVYEEYDKVRELLFKYDNGWVNLPLITTIFPNVETIILFAIHKDIQFLIQSSIYDSILSFTTKHPDSSLTKITVSFNPTFADTMSVYVKEYQNEFAEQKWMIDVVHYNPYKDFGIDYETTLKENFATVKETNLPLRAEQRFKTMGITVAASHQEVSSFQQAVLIMINCNPDLFGK